MGHRERTEWGQKLTSLVEEGKLPEAFLHFCSKPRYGQEGRSWSHYFLESVPTEAREERTIQMLEIAGEFVDNNDTCCAARAMRIVNFALSADFHVDHMVVERIHDRLNREVSSENEPNCNLVTIGIKILARWGSDEWLDRAADLTISYGQRAFNISRAAWAKAFEPRKGWLRRRRKYVLETLATTGVNPVWAQMEVHFRLTGGRDPFVVPELPK